MNRFMNSKTSERNAQERRSRCTNGPALRAASEGKVSSSDEDSQKTCRRTNRVSRSQPITIPQDNIPTLAACGSGHTVRSNGHRPHRAEVPVENASLARWVNAPDANGAIMTTADKHR